MELIIPPRRHQYRGRCFRLQPFPPDRAWRPVRGDEVYLPPRTPFKLSQAGMVVDAIGEYFRVRYSVNRRLKSELLAWWELRPTGRRLDPESGAVQKVMGRPRWARKNHGRQ